MSKWYLISFKNWHEFNAYTIGHDVYEAENPKLAISQAKSQCKYRFQLIDIKKIEGEHEQRNPSKT